MHCSLKDGVITISIDLDTIKCATENHPDLVDCHEPDPNPPPLLLTDVSAFAGEVVATLNYEREDGSTPITDMFDKAIVQAIENGAEGISEEWLGYLPAAEQH